jgi:hypothetical protein
MSISISSFHEKILSTNKPAKANRFVVEITNIPNWSDGQYDMISLFCESVSLPGRQITTMEYSPFLNEIKVPTGYINDDVEMTFLVTEDYSIKKMLDHWLNQVIDPKTYLFNYKDKYVSTITIKCLDEANKTKYTVKLLEAYPYQVNSMEFSMESESSVQKVSAAFAYKDFTIT